MAARITPKASQTGGIDSSEYTIYICAIIILIACSPEPHLPGRSRVVQIFEEKRFIARTPLAFS